MISTGDKATVPYDLRGKRVWIAGHSGMVGSALLRRLKRERCDIQTVSHADVDLTRQADTENWMKKARPEAIFLAAARVGGIGANARYPAEFLAENALIMVNVIRTASELGVEKLLCMGSSCIYPKYADQPIVEEALLTGSLEPTNEAYALAKIAGIKLAAAYAEQYGRRFISVMPTNLYGQNDNFDLDHSHVIPALIRKMHDAKVSHRDSVVVWGTGTPKREFLHVDDLADACVFLMKDYESPKPINVGSGEEISIGELAFLIADIVDFRGHIVFDAFKPDGAPRKFLDSSRLRALGWSNKIALHAGIQELYDRWKSGDRKAQMQQGYS
ncbi:MAG: GDP-L-fucose synthase [Shinella sp.]|uniref:GDP-L-fucose synthase family protein n=1 Tax=Shinella sp. TaxID=1870904 RepID=UPI003C757546